MTIKELTSKLWYASKIAIIEGKEYDVCNDIDDIQRKSLMFGENCQLRSVNYKSLNLKKVYNFGVIDNRLIIITEN